MPPGGGWAATGCGGGGLVAGGDLVGGSEARGDGRAVSCGADLGGSMGGRWR